MWIESDSEKVRRELDGGIDRWSELLTLVMQRRAGDDELDALIDTGRELDASTPRVRGFVALSIGEALLYRDRVDEGLTALSHAAAHYHDALAVQPDDAICWNDYARTLRLLGQMQTALEPAVAVATLQRAVTAFDRCEALRPGAAAVFNNRGNALLVLARAAVAAGDAALARDAADRAVRDMRRGVGTTDARSTQRHVYALNLMTALHEAVQLYDDPRERRAAAGELRKLLSSFTPEQCSDPAVAMNAALLFSSIAAATVERDPGAAVAQSKRALSFAAATRKRSVAASAPVMKDVLSRAATVLVALGRAGQSHLRRELADAMTPIIREAGADPQLRRVMLGVAVVVQEVFFADERWPTVIAIFETVRPLTDLGLLPVSLWASAILTAAGAMQRAKRLPDAARLCSEAIEQLAVSSVTEPEQLAGVAARIRLLAAGIAASAGDEATVQTNLAAAAADIARALAAGTADADTLRTAADIAVKRATRPSAAAGESLRLFAEARSHLEQPWQRQGPEDRHRGTIAGTLHECASGLNALHEADGLSRASCTELVAVLRLLVAVTDDDPEIAHALLAHALVELAIVEEQHEAGTGEAALREAAERLQALGPVDELRRKRSSVAVTHAVLLLRDHVGNETLAPLLRASSPRLPERVPRAQRNFWALLWRTVLPPLSARVPVTEETVDACERILALLRGISGSSQRGEAARLRAPALAILAAWRGGNGDPAEAMKLYKEAAGQYAMLDDEVGRINRGAMLVAAARVARGAGWPREAKAAYEAAARSCRDAARVLDAPAPAQANLTSILCSLAHLAVEAGAFDGAMRYAEEAVRTASSAAAASSAHELEAVWADALVTRADVLRAAGRAGEAEADLRLAGDLVEGAGRASRETRTPAGE